MMLYIIYYLSLNGKLVLSVLSTSKNDNNNYDKQLFHSQLNEIPNVLSLYALSMFPISIKGHLQIVLRLN